MSRRARVLVLLTAMLWQSLGWALPPGITRLGETIAHPLAHAQALGHHHHDDRSLHMEDGAKDSLHFHADSGLQSAGIISLFATPTPPMRVESPPALAAVNPPSGSPESPLRPPRSEV